MIKTTVKIDGMACSMCEAHINEIMDEALRAAIDATGYTYLSSSAEPYVKKGLFGF